ncbi:prion-inhibition and propagation-domain-containing protein [Dactylonectria macrodidyma]|uniref:Prion-inhibition and propagation-domain-containing protein n=1 Tax=Dactylonectria macrodidyma TaxID=307937 RepID=A0A9P9EAD2_9HYPO|nr:prion-inhibition and propagation-domain-containing protein [Dactylonectria macrodidyma]
MEPGTIIAITQIAYDGAKQAVDLVLTAVHFPKECEGLFVQLKLEQFRLQCWGRSAGLEQGRLLEVLHPICSEIRNTLDRICALFRNLDKLQSQFGIISASIDAEKGQKELSNRWNEELRKQGLTTSDKLHGDESLISKEQQDFFPVGTFKVTLGNRLRWALGSKSKFCRCVAELEKHITKLHQLLPERQSLQYQQDLTRINIIIVGKATDEDTVDLLRHALDGTHLMESSLRSLLDRKAVATAPSMTNFLRGNPELDIEAYVVPQGFRNKDGFIATKKTSGELVYFEKKSWDDERSMTNRPKLQARLSRLVAMLRPGRSTYLLKALGVAEDEDGKCWWMAFEIPPAVQSIDSLEILTLHQRFGRGFFRLAPLESRFKLAFALASAYSELFSSGWVHKNINSLSIIYFGAKSDIRSPFVTGLEFSRQETEDSNVDAATTPAVAQQLIYRHPDYIGTQATRYKTQYDIYSFGLLLIEVAFWQPLKSVCPHVATSPFWSAEAQRVKSWALKVVAEQFAFRVGTVYTDVVRWCLENGDANGQTQEDWHPALAFNDYVVVPLAKLS